MGSRTTRKWNGFWKEEIDGLAGQFLFINRTLGTLSFSAPV
jgi:hypothetical protein